MTAAMILQRAEEARRAGRRSDAVRLLGEFVQANGDHPAAHNLLGTMALEDGDAARGETHFRLAAEADAGAAPLWMNLAKAQRLLGDTAGERRSLQRALDTDQRHFMALLRLAELHEREGEDGPALQRWSNVLSLLTTMPDRPAALDDVLRHATAFVAQQQTRFAAEVETALGNSRDHLSVRDRRRFDACLDGLLGRRAIYANQCAGMHYPFLPADEFFDREHFPWFDGLEARTPAIREELRSLLATGARGFAPYVSRGSGAPENKWSVLDGSEDWSALHLWRHGAPIEDACARCPETAAALAAVPQATMPGRAPTAFFSLLRPRTRIPPHTGVSNVRAIVHLPLIVPDGCGFRVGGETRAWEEGRAFAFDDTIEHEAWNNSDELRAVLILDVWNPHLTADERGQIERFFAAADASSHNPGRSAEIVD